MVIVKNSTNINKNSDSQKIPLISTKTVIVKNSTNINKNSDSKKNSTNINKNGDSKKFHQSVFVDIGGIFDYHHFC
jgi:uncharacterized membrane protein YcaP (DUF421 family)